MPEADDPKKLTLAGLAHHCGRETERFLRGQSHDPRYCFELFRRAILNSNDQAWSLVYERYRPLVRKWIQKHSTYPATDEEWQYFLNRAFERMWSAMNPERFDTFSDLGSVLRYLQMCVHTAIIDEARAAEEPTVDIEDEKLLAVATSENGASVGSRSSSRAEHDEFWQQINERLKDEKEHLVIYGSFVLALKPRELYADYMHVFSDVTEIYRIKQNVLARLGRDDELKKLLGENA